MGRVGHESDAKERLVSEICSISRRVVTCAHRHHHHSLIRSPFVDWYRVLGVEENADTDVIRKQYHRLALQLHPDKNKHPEAEIAFKLVAEAYKCLCDNVKRRAFNLERWKNFCIECNKIPYKNWNSSTNSPKPKKWNSTNWSRSCGVLQGLKDIRDRFKEEARVIEKCLRSNTEPRQGSPIFTPPGYLFQSNRQKSQNESPVFNPSDYNFLGYPHLRSRVYEKSGNFFYLQRGNTVKEWGRERYDFPVFENRSVNQMYNTKSTCVRSWF